MKNEKKENERPVSLGWLDPRDENVNHAGVGFYNEAYGEYSLRIDEEPNEKKYYLKPISYEGDQVQYRLDLVLKKSNGVFIKRKQVGSGRMDSDTNGNIHIDYGSKYKQLVVFLEDN